MKDMLVEMYGVGTATCLLHLKINSFVFQRVGLQGNICQAAGTVKVEIEPGLIEAIFFF